MISPTLITSIAFPILFTANTYISYRSNSSIPRGGPLEPYLTACLYLIIQLPTLQYAWGIEPVLAKRLSSLAPPSARTIDMDEETKKRVDSVLVSHQTSCVFLLGTVLVPLIRLSRVYTPPKFGNEATGDGLYLKIGLWAAAAVSCGVCSYLWTAVYEENKERIAQLVDAAATAQDKTSAEKALMSEEKPQEGGPRASDALV